jgi:hypothetical protein
VPIVGARRRALLLSVLLVQASLLQGCQRCKSAVDAEALRGDLQVRSVARAEPVMRSTAERLGAVLLPITAQPLRERPLCMSAIASGAVTGAPEADCELARSADDRAFRFFDANGVARLAITVPARIWRYARLAQRGDTFFVLTPILTRRKLGGATQCTCEAMPIDFSRSEDPGFLQTETYVFVVDDRRLVTFEITPVRVTEGLFDWKCEAPLL